MNLRAVVKKILLNKVVFYIVTRYFTYGIQFLFTFFIAVKLGPYYLGIWGFILLLLNYLSLFNLGISNSINVLLVQYKNDASRSNNFLKTSLYLVGFVCGFFILLALYYYFLDIGYFNKYNLKPVFYLITIIAILTHYNNLFTSIFRVKNDIFKISFYQSIIPVLCFICIFLAKDDDLITLLLVAYIVGNVASLLFFIFDKRISFTGKYSKSDSQEILKKGFHLFIYNTCFYLIMISTKSFVSYFYRVEEFGYFSFTYILSNSILLMLNAFSFIIFPKMIDKLSSQNKVEIKQSLSVIRNNYIVLAHILMYAIIVLYPLFLLFLPQYKATESLFHIMCLTMLMNISCFGFNTFLIAQNKEKLIGVLALTALILNVLSCLLMIKLLNLPYEYIILSTLITYFVYSFLVVFFGKKLLDKHSTFLSIFKEFLPWNLFLPFVFSLTISILNTQFSIWLNGACLMLFASLNVSKFKEIYHTIMRILNRPTIINI